MLQTLCKSSMLQPVTTYYKPYVTTCYNLLQPVTTVTTCFHWRVPNPSNDGDDRTTVTTVTTVTTATTAFYVTTAQ